MGKVLNEIKLNSRYDLVVEETNINSYNKKLVIVNTQDGNRKDIPFSKYKFFLKTDNYNLNDEQLEKLKESKYEDVRKMVDEGHFIEINGIDLALEHGIITEEEYLHNWHGMDKRTKNYIDKIYENLGYIDEEHGWGEEKFETIKKVDNPYFHRISDAEVGKIGDKYIIQYGVRTDIDDYDIAKIYLSKEPRKNILSTFATLKEITHHLRIYKDYKFKCWECGMEAHWLDFRDNGKDSTLESKFEALKEHYCGC